MAGSTGTPKARALGRQLREERERVGLGVRELARKLDISHTAIARYESGERVPKATDVAKILTILGVTGDRYDEILELTNGTDEPRWLAVTLPEQRQQLAAVLAFERTAMSITEVAPLLIPGLLQADDYIRAIMSSGRMSQDEVDTRTAIRIGRRAALTRKEPVHLLAVLGEAALRQMVGGPDVMAAQLQHLLEMAEMPNVDMRVMPFTVDWHPGLEGPFVLIEAAKVVETAGAADAVVHLENRRSGLFLHEPEDVEAYREAVDTLLRQAMSPADSTGLIAKVINELEMAQ